MQILQRGVPNCKLDYGSRSAATNLQVVEQNIPPKPKTLTARSLYCYIIVVPLGFP